MKRQIALAALVSGLVTLWMTGARFGAAAVAGAFLLVVLSRLVGGLGDGASARTWRRTTQATLALALAGALVVLLFSGRAEALTQGAVGGSLEARAFLWDEGRRLVAESPWLGVGRVSLEGLIDGGFPHAHNLYLMKFIETGIAGGTLFVALVLVCVAACLRRLFAPGDEALATRAMCAGFAAFSLYALTDFFAGVGQPRDPALKNLDAWFERVNARPSADASLHPGAKAAGMRA